MLVFLSNNYHAVRGDNFVIGADMELKKQTKCGSGKPNKQKQIERNPLKIVHMTTTELE